MIHSFILGVDIGGSHITSAIVDLSSASIVEKTYVRRRVDSHQSAENIISSWAEAIKESFAASGNRGGKIGIAMPGPMDYEKGISLIKNQDKYDHLYGLNIKELLAVQLQMNPADIRIMNDACSFLRGEALGELEEKYTRIMGFTLGTGLGSAIYINGTVADGDLWQMPFRESIAENYLSTRWFLKRYEELDGGTARDVKHLIESIDQNPVVTRLFAEFGNTLGEFLSFCVSHYKPEVIVLGGNISRSHELFLSYTKQILEQAGNRIPLVIARLGEEAALIGAAGSWKTLLI